MSLKKEQLDVHFKRLRGKLFSLIEASVPGAQQESFKRHVKDFTQDEWSGIGKDAGFIEYERKSHGTGQQERRD